MVLPLDFNPDKKTDNPDDVIDVNRLGQREETMCGRDLEAYRQWISAFGRYALILRDSHDSGKIVPAHRVNMEGSGKRARDAFRSSPPGCLFLPGPLMCVQRRSSRAEVEEMKRVEKEKRTMSNIAVIIDDLFEDSEYIEPVKAFQENGHKIIHVGMKPGERVKGKKGGIEVLIDRAIRDVSLDEFDALLIPGGYSPDKLRAHEEPVEFVRRFFNSGKPVFSICHAPQLLITADVLRGRKITGWKSIVQDIKNAGARFVDEKVVEDGNLVSSRQPGDLPEFIAACLARLQESGD